MTSEQIAEVLRKRHHGHVFIEELRLGSGFGQGEMKRIDFWAIDPAPSKGCEAVAYEIKVSRGDFLRDLSKPLKQRGARLYSDLFFYVAPPGIISPDELPMWAGLIEIREELIKDSWYMGDQVVPAPLRSKERPSWPFIVSVLRRYKGIPA